MQLRTLQTLAEVASENNSTLVFPLPIEILAGFVNGSIGMSSPGAAPATVPLSTVMPAPSVIKGAGAAGARTATASPTETASDASAGVADGLTDDGQPTDDGQSPAGGADADGVSQSA
jgi:hypothetical protein